MSKDYTCPDCRGEKWLILGDAAHRHIQPCIRCDGTGTIGPKTGPLFVEGVAISCPREVCWRFGGLDYRPMKHVPSKPEAEAFAKRVREGKLAFPFNALSHTRITKEPYDYMVWARSTNNENPVWVEHPVKPRLRRRHSRPRLTR